MLSIRVLQVMWVWLELQESKDRVADREGEAPLDPGDQEEAVATPAGVAYQE